MAEKRQFPTPKMLKAEEEWNKKTPEEKEAFENAFREELRKYYANRPSRKMRLALMGEVDDESETYTQQTLFDEI